MSENLSNKQNAFVREYLKDFNSTAAARRAGYKGRENTLASIGSQNLRKLKVREKIDDYLDELALNGLQIIYKLSKQVCGSMAMFSIKG